MPRTCCFPERLVDSTEQALLDPWAGPPSSPNPGLGGPHKLNKNRRKIGKEKTQSQANRTRQQADPSGKADLSCFRAKMQSLLAKAAQWVWKVFSKFYLSLALHLIYFIQINFESTHTRRNQCAGRTFVLAAVGSCPVRGLPATCWRGNLALNFSGIWAKFVFAQDWRPN